MYYYMISRKSIKMSVKYELHTEVIKYTMIYAAVSEITTRNQNIPRTW